MSSRLKILHLTDFTGGLVTNMPDSELQLNQSPDLDNIILLDKGFKQRFGQTTFNSTAMNSGADIQMLAYYKEKSGLEYINAIAGNKVFRSDNLDGTMDELTKASGGTAPSAGQDNIYTPVVLKNLLIWFGPTAPQSWDGSTATNEYQDLAGSPPTAAFAFVMKDRVFAGRTASSPSQLKWCVLANPEDWTNAGSGTQQVVTNDGDILVGGIPLNNNLAILFKQYSIHHLVVETAPFPLKPLRKGLGCCGKHAMVNAHGLIYFISREPRMYTTDGYDIIKAPNTIDDIWNGLSKDRLEFIQGKYFEELDQIHWYVSNGSSTTNNLTIVWDVRRKVWLRYTTAQGVNVAIIARGQRLYTGNYDGKIYRHQDSITNNDSSITSPGSIDAYLKTPWVNFGDNLSVKKNAYMDIALKTQSTKGNLEYAYGYDYSMNRLGSVDQSAIGGQWDVDTWDDTFVWGGQTDKHQLVFLRGRGNVFQFKFGNSKNGKTFQLNSVSIGTKQTGIKEFTAK